MPCHIYTQKAKLMGPAWAHQDPGGPKVGPMNLAIRVRNNLGIVKVIRNSLGIVEADFEKLYVMLVAEINRQ